MKVYAWDEIGMEVSEFNVASSTFKNNPEQTMVLLDYRIMKQIGIEDGSAKFSHTGMIGSDQYGIGRFGRGKLVLYTTNNRKHLDSFDKWYAEQCEEEVPTDEKINEFIQSLE